MTTAAIRKRLLMYIADADEKKIRGLYMLVEDDIADGKKFKLSALQAKMLEQERKKHVAGKSKSYNWQEAKQVIRSKKKA